MILKSWDELPDSMKNNSVKRYYEILEKKRTDLIMKRLFDFFVAIITLVILLPLFLLISIVIKIDSKGPVMFRQARITQYGKQFRIFKFRTMINNAEEIGSQITTRNDERVTRVGKMLRKLKLDEIPQLFNIITGDMTFVGTRPEVPKYLEQYTDEMMATLLLPAGVTNLTCIYYKNENKMLIDAKNADETYIAQVLPGKMKWNLEDIMDFSFWGDIKLLFMTFLAVCGKEYKNIESDVESKTGVSL